MKPAVEAGKGLLGQVGSRLLLVQEVGSYHRRAGLEGSLPGRVVGNHQVLAEVGSLLAGEGSKAVEVGNQAVEGNQVGEESRFEVGSLEFAEKGQVPICECSSKA